MLYLKWPWLILLILLLQTKLSAQYQTSFSLQYINEQVVNSFISKSSGKPIHPGGTLSLEFAKHRDGAYQFDHIFQLGYFHHNKVNQVGFMAYKPSFQFYIGKVIGLQLIPGIAAASSFATQPVYKLENGVYKEVTNDFQIHFMPSIGVGASISLRHWRIPLEVFARQEYALIYPNSRRLPISVNSLLGLGIKYSLTTKNTDHE